MTACPHANIIFCPLYVVSHGGDPSGCVTGNWAEGCAVQRGEMNYAREVAGCPARLVAALKWREDAERLKAQRNLNMRLNGVH